MGSYSILEIWVLIIICGIITYLIRLSFIQFAPQGFIERIKDTLSFMPVAIFTAIATSGVFSGGIKSVDPSNYKIYASIVALLVAMKYKNTILTILSGLIVIWTVNYLIK